MAEPAIIKEYRHRIAQYLNVEDKSVSLFWKGRVAMYAILKAFEIGEGDEVIIPAFTCVVVPNAIIYTGAKPVYVDIDASTFNVDLSKIESKITSKTKAILAQNTFGLSSDIDGIIAIAQKYNLKVIEDCTHGFGGTYKSRLNGTIADASFFSTQWNKPFSTGIGGIAVVKGEWLEEKMAAYESQAALPTSRDVQILRLLLLLKEWVITPKTYWFVRKVYRLLSKMNLVVGSSQKEELEGTVLPADFFKAISELQAAKGIKELKKVNALNQHRRNVAAAYSNLLRKLGAKVPAEPEYATHTFLKYPLLVKDRKNFEASAAQHAIELGDWFDSPIHPIKDGFENWFYKWGENPVSERISAHIVNLPTGESINTKQLQQVLKFLDENQQYLEKEIK